MTQGTVRFTGLPYDVHEIIVDLVAAMDEEDFGDIGVYPGLSALSLAGCRRLLPVCRSYIFRTIKIHSFKEQGRTSRELHEFIDLAPDISHFITELHWNLNFFEAWRGLSHDERCPQVFFKLEKIKKLSILGEHNPIDFRLVPNIAKIFEHFLRLPTLTSLSLKSVRNVSIKDIARISPNLRALRLEDVDTLTESLDPVTTPILLEELSMNTTRIFKEGDDTNVFPALTKLRSATLSIDHFLGYSTLNTLLLHCSKTLHHLKVMSRGETLDNPFYWVSRNLQSIKGTNILESISISIPYNPTNAGSDVAWQTLDSNFANPSTDFPHLRNFHLQVASGAYHALDLNASKKYWKRSESCLTNLREAKDICFTMSVDFFGMDGQILRRHTQTIVQ
ncbi:hypothetical protein BJ165DRAFT_1528084 [Panaeolus papilionaceus]|nr:hypothetical protein BJ165DRAFT_1528084 [Panaeolus papilionaceus]